MKKAIFVLIAGLSALLPTAVFAIEYGGLGGRPAYPRPDNPRSESIFIHTVTPGQIVNEGVLVINNKTEEKTLLVYAADSTPSTDGGYACKQFTEENTGVGTWIELEKSEVTLAPHTSEIVPFTISVPVSVDVGEHNGCILVQEKKEKSKEAGLNLSLRTGLRVALTVPGELIRKLNLLSFTVEKRANGNFFLIPEIENTGNVSVDSDLSVLTKGLFGRVVAEHGGQYTVLRDDTARWNFELVKPFWGGLYKSYLTVEYENTHGDKELLSANTEWFVSAPQPKAMVYYGGAAVLLAVFVGYFLWQMILARKVKKKWEDYIVQPGGNIESIAKRHNVSWKKLAKFNKLKPPYDLEEGQKIKVPPQKLF